MYFHDFPNLPTDRAGSLETVGRADFAGGYADDPDGMRWWDCLWQGDRESDGRGRS
jgi:hypothetical protein